MYEREDIYFCPGCGQFFDERTHKPVEVAYSEMPSDFATTVFKLRAKLNGKTRCEHKAQRAKRKSRFEKGFY